MKYIDKTWRLMNKYNVSSPNKLPLGGKYSMSVYINSLDSNVIRIIYTVPVSDKMFCYTMKNKSYECALDNGTKFLNRLVNTYISQNTTMGNIVLLLQNFERDKDDSIALIHTGKTKVNISSIYGTVGEKNE